jgi:hypothetical protein
MELDYLDDKLEEFRTQIGDKLEEFRTQILQEVRVAVVTGSEDDLAICN